MSEEKKNQCECGCEDEGCDCCDDEVVMLTDEDGNEIAFNYVTTMEYEGKEYVFLQKAEPESEEDDYLEIYEIEGVEATETEEAHDSLFPVEDELYETLYNKLMAEIGQDGCCDDDCDCDDDECHCHDHK